MQEEPDVAGTPAGSPPDGAETNGRAILNGTDAAAEADERDERPADETLDLEESGNLPGTPSAPPAEPRVAHSAVEAEVDENAGLVATFPEVALPPKQYFQEEPVWLPPEFEAQEERAVSPPLDAPPAGCPPPSSRC